MAVKTKRKLVTKTKKAIAKKPIKKIKRKIRERILPDFVKGNFIIVSDDHQWTWTKSGWRSISDNVDDPITFDTRPKALKFIKKNSPSIMAAHAAEAAMMKDHYQNVFHVSLDGFVTSIVQPLIGNTKATAIRQQLKDIRQEMNVVLRQAKIQHRDAQRTVERFNTNMEKYGY